jgi:hypothetical protein
MGTNEEIRPVARLLGENCDRGATNLPKHGVRIVGIISPHKLKAAVHEKLVEQILLPGGRVKSKLTRLLSYDIPLEIDVVGHGFPENCTLA